MARTKQSWLGKLACKAYRGSNINHVKFMVEITNGPQEKRQVEITMDNTRAQWFAESILKTIELNERDIEHQTGRAEFVKRNTPVEYRQ